MKTPQNDKEEATDEFKHLYKVECKTGNRIGEGGRIYRSWSGGRCRILGGEKADYCYHVMSRTCGGDYLFEAEEKEAFRKIMRRMARFCGVKVLTYAVMSNHFHILARVPCRVRFLKRFDDQPGEAVGSGEERLMQHLSILYSKAYVTRVRKELAWMREQHMEADAEKFLLKYQRRFCDLSLFIKEVKERFSRWFNKKHERRGTLWMDRFKSVLVENGEALRTMAAYIDLNAVRAGLVEDPKDYRWCGYAEAMGGSKQARRGLCQVMEKPLDSWGENHDWYRCWLIADAGDDAEKAGLLSKSAIKTNKTITTKEQPKILNPPSTAHTQVPASIYQQLRARIRYFTEGVALGSPEFINAWFEMNREKFSPRRLKGIPSEKKSNPVTQEATPGSRLYTLKGKIILTDS